jgi:hypothetical protein
MRKTEDASAEAFVNFFLAHQREWLEDYTALQVDRGALAETVRNNAEASWSDRLDALMSRLAEKVDSRTERWGDKTPHNIREIPNILENYPSARVIHIYRDPRHVVTSMSDRSFPPAPDTPLLNAEIVRSFHRAYQRAKRELKPEQTRHLYELRYESLVENPRKTLRELFRFLGENYTDTLLEPADEQTRANIGWANYKGWGRLEPQPSSRVDGLPRAVEAHLVELVEGLGYEPTSPTVAGSRFVERLPTLGFRCLSEVFRHAWLCKYPEAHDYILTYLPEGRDYLRWSINTVQQFVGSNTMTKITAFFDE